MITNLSEIQQIISSAKYVVVSVLKKHSTIVGDSSVEVPPVPIPNTEVKLYSGENTWLVTARENRSMPTQTKQSTLKVLCLHIPP